MNKLTRSVLEDIERQANACVAVAGSNCIEHAIQDILGDSPLQNYMYYDGNDDHVSEVWGDLYCVLNEVIVGKGML